MNKSIHQSWPQHTHVIFQKWGKHRFAVEVDSEGVRVYEVHASGPDENKRIEAESREVWIDPHEMTNDFEKRDIRLPACDQPERRQRARLEIRERDRIAIEARCLDGFEALHQGSIVGFAPCKTQALVVTQ